MRQKKKISTIYLFLLFLIFGFSLSGCIVNIPIEIPQENFVEINPTLTTVIKSPTQQEKVIENPKQSNFEEENNFWIDPSLKKFPEIIALGFSEAIFTDNKDQAHFWLEEKQGIQSEEIIYERYFALTVPFISDLSSFDLNSLKELWTEDDSGSNDYWIWVNAKEVTELNKILGGKSGEKVITSENEPEECRKGNCFRIYDFEDVDPTWKILNIDNQSLLSKDFDPLEYPLVYRIWINKNPMIKEELDLPFKAQNTSNYDPSKLTSILLTGTTALVRNTAYQIEQNGYEFPYQNIEDILKSVDLIHVSNEVPFYSECPPAIPVRPEMRFCSDPGYIEVFSGMGVDVVELTGNHLLDWGPDAFLETLSIYELQGINYYGGGETREEAKEPVIIEQNGNKIAFLGCNITGPENNWATDERPGALKCELDELAEIISELRKQDINPIFTFQHFEFNTFRAVKKMQDDFWKMAKAGAVIVSGSQAHYPHGIDFVDSSFIHYGLGNFLFDQTYSYWGMATIDIHYFYNNKYINTNQIAIINENYGQPREMTDEEKDLLLSKLYNNSFYYESLNENEP